jgi:hypothetical protein
MKTASKNLLSFTESEKALDHTLNRGIFGNIWDFTVLLFGSANVILTWVYHQVFQATKEDKLPSAPEVDKPT